MKNLLLLEWMKVRKYRTFWVFMALFVAALVGVNTALFSSQLKLKYASHGLMNIQLFNFPEVWSTTAWASGFSVLVLGLLLIVLITNEFAFRTQRQNIIDGLSRKQFITGKWLVTIVLLLFAWLLYVIVTLVMGTVNYTGGNNFWEGSQSAGYFFLKVALSLSVAFMFAIWLKRSGLAIVLYLLYVLLLEGIAGHFLNLMINHLGSFLPLKAAGELVSNPMYQLMPGMYERPVSAGWLILACVVYLIIFVYISFGYIRRADL